MSRYNIDELSQHYSEHYIADTYNRREFMLYKKYYHLLVKKNAFLHTNDAQLIDLGCGNGIKTSAFGQFFKKTTAIDLSESAILKAREMNSNPAITFLCGNLFDVEVEKASVITAFGFSYLNEDEPKLLAERINELYTLFALDRASMIMSSFTDFSGKAPSGWVMHSKKQLNQLKDILHKEGYRVNFYFPQYDLANYINFGFENTLKELVKFLKSRRRTFFIIIEKEV